MTMDPHRYRFTRERIAARLRLIGPMVHRHARAIEPFRLLPLDGAILDAPICADPSGWDEIAPESYWGRADLNFVMKSGFTIPTDWETTNLALHLPLGVLGDIFNHPEAMAYVDQVPIGSADRYHHTLPLPAELADGRRHVLSLHGWTGHAGWPPDPNSKAKLFMGACSVVSLDTPTKAFCDLAEAALDTVSVVEDPVIANGILSALDTAFARLDTRDPLGDAFYDAVPAALATLKDALAEVGPPLDKTLYAIGHAHMDIAYLWPISQMQLKNHRTYSNVLRLMDDHADFRFSHSQPALYEMTMRDHPALFDRIKTRVAQGRWEVMGGMWVEPDLNVPGPEALIRQLTLGRGYFEDTFGPVETPVLWLPDTFGFPGQVPQLMKLAGLDWFVTNKLNWNQYNRVPWSSHIWEGIDGSQVKAHILTTPRDVQYLPFATNYKSDLTAYEVLGTVTHANGKASDALPICFGYGDGGGGPTQDLLAKASAYAAMPGMPKIQLSTVRGALAALDQGADEWPVWKGEHYLEGHRGVFTSQGWIKRANRIAERALHEAEAMAAMAGLAPDLTEAWKLLCLNQFHDIVTGTSVPEVYEDARRDYARISEISEAAALDASAHLAGSLPSVANTSPTTGPRVAVVQPGTVQAGQSIDGAELAFFPDLPAYSLTPLTSASAPMTPVRVERDGDQITLENGKVRARFSQGELVAFVDLESGRALLAEGETGNQLIAFEDRPICWDAWDIDSHYEDNQELIGPAQSVEISEQGPIRATVRLIHKWRNSTLTQDISLSADSYRLDFDTRVDWHETHTLLKVAFPVAIDADQATFDTQWGTIDRSTRRETDFDAARFEVSAQKWAELADDTHAVALMNDCKYGYDVRDNVLRLTLIKSATSPDPNADQGEHVFTYALMSNPGRSIARRNHAAYDLNTPLRVLPSGGVSGPKDPFVTSDAENVVIETLKPSNGGAGVVLRVFECAGHAAVASLTFGISVSRASLVDIFERYETDLSSDGSKVTVSLNPFQIMTIKVAF